MAHTKPYGRAEVSSKIIGNTAQFVGSVGDAFSAICCLQIFRFTSSKPSKSAIASDEKFIRLRTNSFVRYCLYSPYGSIKEMKQGTFTDMECSGRKKEAKTRSIS